MACTSVSLSGAAPAAAAKDHRHDGLHRSESGGDLRRGDLRRGVAGMRRSRSEPQLRCTLSVPRAAASIKSSRSFPFPFSGSLLPSSLRSFLFDTEEATERGIRLVDPEESDAEAVASEEGVGSQKRANWVERLLELRSRWRDRQQKKGDGDGGGEEDYNCSVIYDSEEEEGEEERREWDRDSFSRFLIRVPWSDTKLFSQLAFLCNMAYVIPEIKAEDLRGYYDLRLVTSSLAKKSEAAAIKAKLEKDSTRPPPACGEPDRASAVGSEKRRPFQPSVAYEIAASAASYVHSRAKGLLSLGGGPGHCPAGLDGDDATGSIGGGSEGGPLALTAPGRLYKSEVAAYVAASTMTAVVAAEEAARQEAAKDLQSLHSSPCEWFICDEPSTCTRCFVIQGSDSLASWQANLFFEPTKFEGTEVLVHRGIYEAAKGLYEQFMPEIQAHLSLHGDRARLRFTGHSLGGSLSLLVSLMLLARRAVRSPALLPVVTFGSPSVFCGGHRVLHELGLDEGHVCSVVMHRDIVPRAFSCNYPNHVAAVLKRLNAAFRSHPCLNNDKLLYSPLGQLYVLQPDDKSSPPHPLLPPGAALYALDRQGGGGGGGGAGSALRAFLNSPHPLETLSDPKAYGSEGTILRDHESSNYLKAVNGLLRLHTRTVVRRARRQRLHQLWPLLTTAAGHSWGGRHEPGLEKQAEVVTGA